MTNATAVTIEFNAAPGRRYLSLRRLCDKLSRGRTWIYCTLKNDPTFPRPIRLGAWQVFAEDQVDEWIAKQAQRHEEAA
jgi:predicted DNA-binding transcriptional regulator AlpA